MSELVREEPPEVGPTQKLSVRYADELEKVRAEPGEWFRLMDYSHLSQGGLPKSHDAARRLRSQMDGFEFRPVKGRVYVRWVGP